jgi:hypothetical protein
VDPSRLPKAARYTGAEVRRGHSRTPMQRGSYGPRSGKTFAQVSGLGGPGLPEYEPAPVLSGRGFSVATCSNT